MTSDFRDIPEYCNNDGAYKLAAKIKRYWMQTAGHDPQAIVIQENGMAVVRTLALVNGLPDKTARVMKGVSHVKI